MKKIFGIVVTAFFALGMLLSLGAYANDDDESGTTNTNINTPIAVASPTNINTPIAIANPTINNNPITVQNTNVSTNPVAIGIGGQGGQGGAGGQAYSNSSAGSYAGSQAFGGNSSLNSNQQASVGDITVQVRNPDPLPPAANIPSAGALSPALNQAEGMGANAQGHNLALKYLEECGISVEDGVARDEMHEKGRTRLTNISWVPHNNYEKFGDGHRIKNVEVESLPKLLGRGKNKFTCIGILQVEAIGDDEAGSVNIATIFNDAATFLKGRLSGYNNLIAISSNDTISVNSGVVSQGGGLGISGGLSGMANRLLGTAGTSATLSDGATFKSTQIGATFIIVTDATPPGATMINVTWLQ